MKFVLVVFLVFCAFQGAYCDDLSSITKLVNQVLQELLKAVQAVLAILKPLLDQILNSAKNIVATAGQAISLLLDGVLSELQKLIGEAADLGLDITKCAVDPVIESVEDLQGPAVANLTKCANTASTNAQAVLDKLLGIQKTFVDQANAILADAKKCPAGILSSITCYASLSLKLAGLLVTGPATITASLPGLTADLQKVANDLTACTTNIINGVVTSATALVHDSVVCVSGIIDGS